MYKSTKPIKLRKKKTFFFFFLKSEKILFIYRDSIVELTGENEELKKKKEIIKVE